MNTIAILLFSNIVCYLYCVIMMKFNFSGKKALVTGGTRGIGRDIVEGLAKAGVDKIYVLAQNQERLDKLKLEVPCVIPISVDLGDWRSTRTVVESIEPLDYLVNNAAYIEVQSFLDISEDNIDRTYNVNVKAIINVSQVVCKRMIEHGGGIVVNISSITGCLPLPNIGAYCTTKGAVQALTRQMALELAPKIRVNSVNPTLILTDMGSSISDDVRSDRMKEKTPMGRFGHCEEVTSAVLYLLSDDAAMVHGHSLAVDGGYLTA